MQLAGLPDSLRWGSLLRRAQTRLRIFCFLRDRWRCVDCAWEPDVAKDFRQFGLGPPPTEQVPAGCGWTSISFEPVAAPVIAQRPCASRSTRGRWVEGDMDGADRVAGRHVGRPGRSLGRSAVLSTDWAGRSRKRREKWPRNRDRMNTGRRQRRRLGGIRGICFRSIPRPWGSG